MEEKFAILLEHLREIFTTIRPYEYEIAHNDSNLYWYYIDDRDLLCLYDPHLDIIRILYLYEPLHFNFRKDHLFVIEKGKAIYIPYEFGFHSYEQYIIDFIQNRPLWIPSSCGKDIFIELFSDELLLRIYHVNWENLREYEIQDFHIPSPKDIYRIKFAEETYIIRNLGSHYEFQFDVEGEFPEILYQSSHLEVEGKEIYPITIKKEFKILERDIGTFGFSHGRFYYKFGKSIVCTSPFSFAYEEE